MAVFIGQLATGSINIFSPRTAQPHIHTVLFQILHKNLYFSLFGYFKPGKINRIVLNDINKIGRNLAV
jgi:hypothetical protein